MAASVTAAMAWAALATPAPSGAATGVSAGAAVSAAAAPSDGTLSWRLSQFLDARDQGKSAGQVASAVSLPRSGPGSLLRAPDGSRLIVTVRFTSYDADEVAAVDQAGGEVIDRKPDLRRITVAVAPADLEAVSEVAGVEYVGEQLTPMTNGTCDSTISEGDGILHADTLRSAQGLDGTGVKVGVISDSYSQLPSPDTTAAQDVASDNLPGSANTCGHTTDVGVGVQPSGTQCGCTDEGRAMTQVVHDLAPGATMDFESADLGEDTFATNIVKLGTQGAKVIVDDVTYFDEPYYQEGVVAQAVSTVRSQGIDYFSSAANNSLQFNGHEVGSYEAVDGYRPTTCPQVVTDYLTNNHLVGEKDCHDFDGGAGTDNTFGFTGVSGNHIDPDLQWAEGGGHVNTDLDEFLVDETTNTVVAISFSHSTTSGSPFEFFDFKLTGDDYGLVVARRNDAGAGTPRFKIVNVTDGANSFASLEYQTPTGTDVMGPTAFGHNDGVDTEAVGASSVFSSPSSLEPYSSFGPVTLLFDTAGNPLGSPTVLAKPDITATDCGVNTFFGGGHHFCGTSQAAPHAAAVAALLIQRQPGITPAQINSALESTAVPLAGTPANHQGAGLINAAAAGNSLGKRASSLSLSAAPPAPTYGDPVTATADLTTIGQPTVGVTISVDGSPVPVTTSGTQTSATLNGLTGGDHQVEADFAGDAAHTASSKTITVTVAKAAQAITFTTTPPHPLVDKGYRPAATGGGSGNPVFFGVDPGSAAVCHSTGQVIHFDHVGTCVITADQAGDGNYEAAPTADQTIQVHPTHQHLRFLTGAGGPVTAPFATTKYHPQVNGVGALTYHVSPGSTCSVDGSVVTFLRRGVCTLVAMRAGDADHLPAFVSQRIHVRRALTVTHVAVRRHSIFIQVLPKLPGKGTPTGYVNVTIDGKRTSYLLQDGTVSIHRTLSSVPPGHYVVAVYVHSPVFRESTGTGIAPH